MLLDQDRRRWDTEAIGRGVDALERAEKLGELYAELARMTASPVVTEPSSGAWDGLRPGRRSGTD